MTVIFALPLILNLSEVAPIVNSRLAIIPNRCQILPLEGPTPPMEVHHRLLDYIAADDSGSTVGGTCD